MNNVLPPTHCPNCGCALADVAPPLTTAQRLRAEARALGEWQSDDTVSAATAARLLGRAAATLNWWRAQLAGPTFIRHRGRVRYSIAALAAFVDGHVEVHGPSP